MVVLGIFAFIGCVVELSSAFPQATEQLVPFAFQNGPIDEARFSACRGSRARWLTARSDASNQEMVECIKDLLAASYRNLRTSRGLPNLGVPPMEPLLVDSASVKDSSVFTGTIKNIKVNGFSEAFLRQNIEVIPPKDASGVTVVKMKAPKGLSLTGDFEAVANILKSVLPFYSGPSSRVSGLFEATIDNPVLIVTARYLQDAEKGATVDGVKLGFNFNGGNVKLNNERLLSGAILTLLNSLLEDQDVSRTVINEVTPDILRRFQEPMYNLLDSGLDESREILS